MNRSYVFIYPLILALKGLLSFDSGHIIVEGLTTENDIIYGPNHTLNVSLSTNTTYEKEKLTD